MAFVLCALPAGDFALQALNCGNAGKRKAMTFDSVLQVRDEMNKKARDSVDTATRGPRAPKTNSDDGMVTTFVVKRDVPPVAEVDSLIKVLEQSFKSYTQMIELGLTINKEEARGVFERLQLAYAQKEQDITRSLLKNTTPASAPPAAHSSSSASQNSRRTTPSSVGPFAFDY